MQLKRLAATFGRLEKETLDLAPGLNVIEAPNEGGKSTWAAFLRVMLYGLSTRDRSPIADKRRYLPWSGSPMEGVVDLTARGRSITIARSTARAAAPMGVFSAVYTDTAQPVEWLTAAGCGETLLGIPLEVYRRSAYIRQTGMAVDQDPALERRIAALITTGEEDAASYTHAFDRLKQQRNSRRHNRTGTLPQLEREMEALRDKLAEIESLRGALVRHQAEEAVLNAQQEPRPTRGELETLRGNIDVLVAQERALRETEDQVLAHQDARRRAEEALADHPMAGKTPAEAAQLRLDLPPRPRYPIWAVVLAVLAGAALAGALWYFGKVSPLVMTGSSLGLMGLLLLIAGLTTASRQKRWEAHAADLRRAHGEEVESYAALYQAALDARTACQVSSAAYQSASVAFRSDLEPVLSAVRALGPGAADLDGARRTVEEALSRRTAQEERRQDQLSFLRQQIHTIQGRIQALGSPSALEEDLSALTQRHAALQEEYEALTLAMGALTAANTELQSRFSPALGEKAAQLFTKITGGKYNKVVMDREMSPSAQEAEGLLPREAALLSQGAADQLYLAVRLAICQLVLPEEEAAPILLDDALTSFDDERMAAALDLLCELSWERQILLFTCQRREGAYLRRSGQAANIIRL